MQSRAYYYVSSYNPNNSRYYVIGIVENTGAVAVTNARVVVDTFLHDGEAYESGSALTYRTTIPAGERSPFFVSISCEYPDSVTTYDVACSGTAAGVAKSVSVAITNDDLTWMPSTRFEPDYFYGGEIVNQGARSVVGSSLHVSMAFYDYDNVIQYVSTCDPMPQYSGDLPSGASIPIGAWLSSDPGGSWDVWVDGEETESGQCPVPLAVTDIEMGTLEWSGLPVHVVVKNEGLVSVSRLGIWFLFRDFGGHVVGYDSWTVSPYEGMHEELAPGSSRSYDHEISAEWVPEGQYFDSVEAHAYTVVYGPCTSITPTRTETPTPTTTPTPAAAPSPFTPSSWAYLPLVLH